MGSKRVDQTSSCTLECLGRMLAFMAKRSYVLKFASIISLHKLTLVQFRASIAGLGSCKRLKRYVSHFFVQDNIILAKFCMTEVAWLVHIESPELTLGFR